MYDFTSEAGAEPGTLVPHKVTEWWGLLTEFYSKLKCFSRNSMKHIMRSHFFCSSFFLSHLRSEIKTAPKGWGDHRQEWHKAPLATRPSQENNPDSINTTYCKASTGKMFSKVSCSEKKKSLCVRIIEKQMSQRLVKGCFVTADLMVEIEKNPDTLQKAIERTTVFTVGYHEFG